MANTSELEKIECMVEGCEGNYGDAKHKCDIIPLGIPLGDPDNLGKHVFEKEGYYGGKYSNHPFYINTKKHTKKNGTGAHHLITTGALKSDEEVCNIVRVLGYNINHSNNAVILPTVMYVACYQGVPLHRSKHPATFIYKSKIQRK